MLFNIIHVFLLLWIQFPYLSTSLAGPLYIPYAVPKLFLFLDLVVARQTFVGYSCTIGSFYPTFFHRDQVTQGIANYKLFVLNELLL